MPNDYNVAAPSLRYTILYILTCLSAHTWCDIDQASLKCILVSVEPLKRHDLRLHKKANSWLDHLWYWNKHQLHLTMAVLGWHLVGLTQYLNIILDFSGQFVLTFHWRLRATPISYVISHMQHLRRHKRELSGKFMLNIPLFSWIYIIYGQRPSARTAHSLTSRDF